MIVMMMAMTPSLNAVKRSRGIRIPAAGRLAHTAPILAYSVPGRSPIKGFSLATVGLWGRSMPARTLAGEVVVIAGGWSITGQTIFANGGYTTR
jgi:hypothetical protein